MKRLFLTRQRSLCLHSFWLFVLISFPVMAPVWAQTPDLLHYYGKPLAFDTLTLSGSMGEFRSNHFHGGMDFRVGGVIGAPVRSVADGYISRISVSPSGYGNALYVTHPNGTTSVYGHLDRFNSSIAEYVKEAQYQAKSFAVDLKLTPEQLPVKKGQEIARAGNTGDSAGPHLHFEIRYRDSLTFDDDMLVNPMHYGIFSFIDTQAPQFRNIHLYGYSSTKDGVARTPLVLAADLSKSSQPVRVPDTFFVAVAAIDKMENTYAKMGIERWQVTLDGEEIYHFENIDLPQSRTRFINSLIFYPQKAEKGRSMLKTWVEPGNCFDDRTFAPTQGLFSLKDSLAHTLVVTVYDGAGNSARRQFVVRRKNPVTGLAKDAGAAIAADAKGREEDGQVFKWNQSNHFSSRGVYVNVPAGALYKNIRFTGSVPSDSLIVLHTDTEPLQMPMTIRWRIPSSYTSSLYPKMLLLRKTLSNTWVSAGGQVQDSLMTASLMSFGTYKLGLDTIPPTVNASFNKGADIRGRKSISFVLKDACSGVDSYEVTIDGEWYLFSYDAKNARITGVLDSKRLTKGQKHSLELVVEDRKGNATALSTSFLW